jgi:hypothetical protein
MGKARTCNEMVRKKVLQYWNSGSPVAHKAFWVVAGKREERDGGKGRVKLV